MKGHNSLRLSEKSLFSLYFCCVGCCPVGGKSFSLCASNCCPCLYPMAKFVVFRRCDITTHSLTPPFWSNNAPCRRRCVSDLFRTAKHCELAHGRLCSEREQFQLQSQRGRQCTLWGRRCVFELSWEGFTSQGCRFEFKLYRLNRDFGHESGSRANVCLIAPDCVCVCVCV